MAKELKSTQLKKKAFIANMTSTLGNITSSCMAAGISRQTYYNWMRDDLEFKQSVEDVIEESIDFVESSLMERIKEGDTTATIFYLKTKGKSRGYVEKTQNETIVKNEMSEQDKEFDKLPDEAKDRIVRVIQDEKHKLYLLKHENNNKT